MSVGNKTLVTWVCCFAAAGYLNLVQYHEEWWWGHCYRDVRFQTAFSTSLGALVCTEPSVTTFNASVTEM